MTLDDVLAKVRKLRALSQSTNEHEAAAAAAAADRLIQQHRLDEAAVEMGAPGDACESPVDVGLEGERRTVDRWRRQLLSGLCLRHGCVSYTSRGAVTGMARSHLVGRPSDVSSVRFLFAWLSAEIERLSGDRSGHGRRWLNSYRHGCVSGCLGAMRRAEEGVRAASSSTALVKLDARVAEAEAALRERHGRMPVEKAARLAIDEGAFVEGKRDGAGISCARQLGSGA